MLLEGVYDWSLPPLLEGVVVLLLFLAGGVDLVLLLEGVYSLLLLLREGGVYVLEGLDVFLVGAVYVPLVGLVLSTEVPLTGVVDLVLMERVAGCTPVLVERVV